MDLTQLQTSELAVGFAESRIGGRAENQDNFGSAVTPCGYLVTVCDGMGGGPGGKTASTIAVTEIIDAMMAPNQDGTVENNLIKAVRRANMAIIQKGTEVPQLQGMGSTCTVVLMTEKCAYVAHVGDSRVYQFRGHAKVFRTFDHSMVFDLVKQKVLTEEQARLSAQSNVITRALGIKPDVEVEVEVVPYEAGDRFMLCTDGIHGTMPEKNLIALATRRNVSLGAVVDEVATTVDNLGRTHGGGHDNLTLILIETLTNSILKVKMSARIKQLLIALGLLCVVSVAFNIAQFSSHGLTSGDLDFPTNTVRTTDSLRSVIGRHVEALDFSDKALIKDCGDGQKCIDTLLVKKMKKQLIESINKDFSSFSDYNTKALNDYLLNQSKSHPSDKN